MSTEHKGTKGTTHLYSLQLLLAVLNGHQLALLGGPLILIITKQGSQGRLAAPRLGASP